ncbi:MAG: hypothetical protein ACLU99_10215 [Alphaproteobacteria bacterium]
MLAQGLGTGVEQAFGLFDGVGGSFFVNTFGHGFFTDQNVAVKVFLSFRAENGKKQDKTRVPMKIFFIKLSLKNQN